LNQINNQKYGKINNVIKKIKAKKANKKKINQKKKYIIKKN
jgi:hypothetical protein